MHTLGVRHSRSIPPHRTRTACRRWNRRTPRRSRPPAMTARRRPSRHSTAGCRSSAFPNSPSIRPRRERTACGRRSRRKTTPFATAGEAYTKLPVAAVRLTGCTSWGCPESRRPWLRRTRTACRRRSRRRRHRSPRPATLHHVPGRGAPQGGYTSWGCPEQPVDPAASNAYSLVGRPDVDDTVRDRRRRWSASLRGAFTVAHRSWRARAAGTAGRVERVEAAIVRTYVHDAIGDHRRRVDGIASGRRPQRHADLGDPGTTRRPRRVERAKLGS